MNGYEQTGDINWPLVCPECGEFMTSLGDCRDAECGYSVPVVESDDEEV